MSKVLLVDDDISPVARALVKQLVQPIKIIDSPVNKPHNYSTMNAKSLLAGMAAMMATGGMGSNWGLSAPHSINFNLRRDNDNDALASANRKIEQAREENRKKKLARAANKV